MATSITHSLTVCFDNADECLSFQNYLSEHIIPTSPIVGQMGDSVTFLLSTRFDEKSIIRFVDQFYKDHLNK